MTNILNLNILFIDDASDDIEVAKDHLVSKGHTCKIANFYDARDIISEFKPHIVILDTYAGPIDAQNLRGKELFKFIWDHQFCPIIIFSNDPDGLIQDPEIKEEKSSHPLVQGVKKGSKSELEIEEYVNKFKSQVAILQKVMTDFDERIRKAMRVVSDYVLEQSDNDREELHNNSEQLNSLNDTETNIRIERLLTRRAAALINELLISDEPLESWEQYIIPPLSEDLLLGDVLRKKDSISMNPDDFCLVLSPSCDLAKYNGKTKVDEVLVAKCCSNEQALIELNLITEEKANKSLSNKDLRTIKKKLRSDILTQGYSGNFIPLPKVIDKIPSMMVNLKKLQLISLDNSKNSSNFDTIDTFTCVASLESPFRELIAWAYQQIACRPGLPERNFASWGEEIMETLN